MESLTPHLLEPESALRPVGRGYAVCRVPQPRPDVTEGPGPRLVLRNRAPALTAAHGNETAALSLFEQPFCSGVQGAKVALLRGTGPSTDRQVERSNRWRTTNRSNRGSGGGEKQ